MAPGRHRSAFDQVSSERECLIVIPYCYCLRLRDIPLPSRLKCCSRTKAAENSSAGVASRAVHSCHILSRLTDFSPRSTRPTYDLSI